jgi:hypothetical protein
MKIDFRNPNFLIGIMLLLLGGFFLLDQFLSFDFGQYFWPFFIIIPGVVIFAYSTRLSEGKGEGLAIFGGMITATGSLLLIQSITGWWASWAYAWSLIAPTSIGLSMMLRGTLIKEEKQVNEGKKLVKIGLIIFAAGFVFFELLIGISGIRIGTLGGSIALVVAGILVILYSLLHSRKA